MDKASAVTSPATVTLTPRLISSFKPAKVFSDQVQAGHSVTSLSFDDRGEYAVTAQDDETIQLWNCKSGTHTKALYSKKYGVHLARFTHKASAIIYASTKEDDTIRYHSLHDNKYLQYFRGHVNKVLAIEMSPLDDTFLSAAVNDSVRLWDLRTPTCQGMMKLQGHPVVAYDLTGQVFAIALNERNAIMLYDVKMFTSQPFMTIILDDTVELSRVSMPPRTPVITSLEFSPDSNQLLVGTASDVHYIVNSIELVPGVNSIQRRLIGHEGLERVESNHFMVAEAGISGQEVCWSPDGRFVLGGGARGTVCAWHVPEGDPQPGEEKNLLPVAKLDGHTGPSRVVAFNPRTAMFASAGSGIAFWLLDPNATASIEEAPSGIVASAL